MKGSNTVLDNSRYRVRSQRRTNCAFRFAYLTRGRAASWNKRRGLSYDTMTGLGHIWKTGTRSHARLYSIGKRPVVPAERVTHSGLRATFDTWDVTFKISTIRTAPCFLIPFFFTLLVAALDTAS
uniref:Uncharacterized protein n=1 Tax=Vespula pensylvanica TaxID=30213 RepID=A0A834UAP8_VESPE|nr:hypothetical protein H0235_006553 [Vespula pensylvanica]